MVCPGDIGPDHTPSAYATPGRERNLVKDGQIISHHIQMGYTMFSLGLQCLSYITELKNGQKSLTIS